MMNISVITIVRNGAGTIRDCIESVLAQSHPVEYIIVDGGSTDATLEIISEYKSKISRIISEPDNGIYDAMNKGISAAGGDVIGILNSDDFYADADVLPKVAKMLGGGNIDSCYGDLTYIDVLNSDKVVRYWRSGEYDVRRLYNGWMPPHPTFFVRRSIYERYGNFNLSMGSSADYELMIRFLLRHRITAAYIPEVLVKMRTGGVSNASIRNRIRANTMDRLAWQVNGLKPFPWTLFLKPLSKIPQYFKKGASYVGSKNR